MARPATPRRLPSVEEYLRCEQASDVRHEYVAGGPYALADASRRHNRIALNIATRLVAAARGGSCRVYAGDVKLRAAQDIIYYPDVMVACGPAGRDPLVEDAPCLVIEVTSPSTDAIDRREKLVVYKQIPSLEGYVIVDQDRRRVERHWRDEAGHWIHAEAADTGTIPLPCPEVGLSLDDIYEGTDVEGPPEPS
ncbi:MAG: Uma2 family endonuclease [Gemmatimonadetes bacterium]|nr:Uma2 family endonuclease [Gemmatimonadota bacterium]